MQGNQATNQGVAGMGAMQPPQMPQMPTPPAEPTPEQQMSMDLNNLLSQTNIAEKLKDEELDKIGVQIKRGYDIDLQSKSDWDKLIDGWVSLAAQIKEEKSWPWRNAANVKYPLLSTAALQFAARAYPSLVPADGKIVQMKVVGKDQQGMKAEKADRLAAHMNYQILVDMQDWEEEMDRLLTMLPIVGCLFKKTYFDSINKRNVSKLLGPKDLVVNYWASGLDSAHRKTEIIQMTKNQVHSMQAAGLYREIDLPDPALNPELPTKSDVHKAVAPSERDETTPYVILEQHTFYDLDDDGYAEPYIITIESQSRKVLRIVARWDSDGVKSNEKGDVICIEPVEYYTKYGFIPNPDGGFYDVGFGHLLGPLNESANTIINQLLDAGTMSNLQAGFIGKGLRIKMGEVKFQPGEWKLVNTTGQDIKQQIFPLPAAPPNEVLFKLLGLIIESSEKLASVAEIFVGKMPGQNTPATTTMASIEQGMKVFTAIYKRVYRSLSKEFKKLFRLNSIHKENLDKAQHILDAPISPTDYDGKTYDVCPTADPTAVSSTQKLLKAQGLMEILPLGTINVLEVTKRLLEAQEQPNLEMLMNQPTPPPPDPKVVAAQQKSQMDKESHALEMQKSQMEAQQAEKEAAMNMQFKQRELAMDMQAKQMELRLKAMEAQMDAQHGAQKHRLDMVKSVEKHKVDMAKMKEKNDAKAASSRVAGKSGNSGSKGSGSRAN